jgi:hypothetical protein
MAGKATDSAQLLYARHASADFNARMQGWLTSLSGEVRQAMGENLIALVLGGGYGRGEGGVLRVSGEERPYNDLDLVLIVQRKSGLPWEALHAIQHKYAALTGIEVDFSRPLTVDDVRAWPTTLMWSDLLQGHRVLDGPADILTGNAPDLRSDRLPPVEATRLLLNRGAGLLWALRVVRGCEAGPDADFIRRNFYKCGLALGDALLISHERFATPYAGRGERLAKLLGELSRPFPFDLRGLYEEALRFKFWPGESASTPGETQLEEMAREWGQVLLYVEGRRVQREFGSAREYSEWHDAREPEQNMVARWPRNLVRNRQLGCWSLRYPRERLYRELPILLGLSGSKVPDWPAGSARFLAVWKQVN